MVGLREEWDPLRWNLNYPKHINIAIVFTLFQQIFLPSSRRKRGMSSIWNCALRGNWSYPFVFPQQLVLLSNEYWKTWSDSCSLPFSTSPPFSTPCIKSKWLSGLSEPKEPPRIYGYILEKYVLKLLKMSLGMLYWLNFTFEPSWHKLMGFWLYIAIISSNKSQIKIRPHLQLPPVSWHMSWYSRWQWYQLG